MKLNFKKGFTLIELLVVVAIIGILASVVFASTSNSKANAKVASATSTLRSFVGPLQICLNDNVAINLPTETNNGGGGVLCAGNSTTYVALPSGWIYCNGIPTAQGTTDCGGDISSQVTGSSWIIIAESPADGRIVTCTSAGSCNSATDSN